MLNRKIDDTLDAEIIVGEVSQADPTFIQEQDSLNSFCGNRDSENILDDVISNDISILKNEKFNLDMAIYLMTEKDLLTSEEKRRLKKMVKNRIKGNVFEAQYKLGKDADGTIGRWCVKNGVGLQGLQRDIRNALMKDLYWDADYMNAQVEILRQMCIKRGWNCDALTVYCDKREEKFLEFEKENEMFTRSYMKQQFIKLLFGGVPDYNTPVWIRDVFYPCVYKIMLNISKAYPELKQKVARKKSKNINGSVCALVLQTEERKCLMALDNFLGKNGRYLGILIHDGGGVERLPNETQFPIQLLRDAEISVFEKTGYKLKLDIKPIETTFVIPNKREFKLENSYPFVKTEFEQTYFKCISNSSYYELKNDSVKIRSKKQMQDAWQHKTYEIKCPATGLVMDVSFMKDWMNDKDIRVYESVGLYPPPLKCPENYFNLWTGFRIERFSLDNLSEKVAVEVENGFQKIMSLFHLVYGDECFEYSMNWNAFLIQNPGLRHQVMKLIKSIPGLGKDLIFQIFKNIFGDKYCLNTQKIERDIFGEFNSQLEGKLFVCFNEIKMKVAAKLEEEIKDIITALHVTINGKGIEKYPIDNLLSFICFSNNDFPIKIAENDRRFVAIDSNGEKESTEYYQEIILLLQNDLVLRKVFDYFMERDLTSFNLERDRPHTQFLDDLKVISRSFELNFFIDLIEQKQCDFSYTPQKLFTKYCEFLTSDFAMNDFSGSSVRKLAILLGNLNINGVIKGKDNKSNRVWIFKIKEAKKWMIDKGYIEEEKEQIRLLTTENHTILTLDDDE